MDPAVSGDVRGPGDAATGVGIAPRPDAAPTPLVRIDDVSVRYDLPRHLWSRKPSSVLAVDRVSLSVPRGGTLGIVGATGSGKSTLAHVVMGMQPPTSGSVVIADRDVATVKGDERRALQRLRQVVLQDPYSSLNPRSKVGSIIAEPIRHDPASRGLSRSALRERVAELLGLVGLPPSRAELYPHQFSGGQRQRISIARALAPRPQLIVLDEPTSALDVSVRAQILTLLKDLQNRLGVTYMIISHDLVTVAYLASTVAVMHRGRVVELGPTESIYRRARHPYTVELLASTPSLSGAFLKLPSRPDDHTADLPPAACPFAARCGLRERLGRPARCLEEPPELSPAAPGHAAACHFSAHVADLAEDVGIERDE
jgi:oligopeptide/dipeptide ABC transporter ATP-binding protein